MASASSKSAKNLFTESKMRLADRVQVNVNNIAAVARQIHKGSKSNEMLMSAAKQFAMQEHAIENTDANLKKLLFVATHLQAQHHILLQNAEKIEPTLEQATIERALLHEREKQYLTTASSVGKYQICTTSWLPDHLAELFN